MPVSIMRQHLTWRRYDQGITLFPHTIGYKIGLSAEINDHNINNIHGCNMCWSFI